MAIRRPAPLKASLMVASILGFLVAILYISKFSIPWAASFAIVFFCIFAACLISMERASPDEQLKPR